jgi:predicted GH43/DUF377 family glycosyl hydrolase
MHFLHSRTLANISTGLALLLLCQRLCAQEPAALAVTRELFPAELVEFVPYRQNPVFTGRGDAFWDAAIRERGWILREGDDWRLWYTGYDGTREGRKRLGLATSRDGLHWTRRDQPVIDADWVEDAMVLRQGDTYYLFAEGEADRAHWFTSRDGLHWIRQGTLDIRQVDGHPISPGPFGTPFVWREGDFWHLVYERGDRGIWLATSKDLQVWTHVQDEPVMTPTPSEHGQIAVNQVIKHGDRYYAYYHAVDDPVRRTWNTNVATSEDLLRWQRYPGNPLVRGNQSSSMVVDDGHGLRLYTMHPQVNVYLPAAAEDSAERPR